MCMTKKKVWKIVEFWIFVNLLSGISRVILRHLLPPISLINTRVAQVLLRPTTCWIFLELSFITLFPPFLGCLVLTKCSLISNKVVWEEECGGGGGDLSNLSQMNCRLSVYCVEWRVVECLARRSVPISWHLSIPRSPLISLGGCKLTRVKTITVSSLKMKFSCVCTTLPFISLEQFPTECKKWCEIRSVLLWFAPWLV